MAKRWQGGMARVGMPAGVLAALALYGSSLAGLADVDRRLTAAAERERHDITALVAGDEDCHFAPSFALRRSAPDA